MEEETTADWSTLPTELLHSIYSRLQTHTNTLRFQAVCKSWRNSASFKKSLPSRLTLPFPNGFITVALYTLYRVSSKSGEFDFSRIVNLKIRKSGKQRLVDPLTQYTTAVPCGTRLQNIVNMLDYDLHELCTIARVKSVRRSSYCRDDKDFGFFQKIVISEDNNAAMAVSDMGKLCYWKLREERWIDVDKNCSKYVDVISYKGGFCAVEDTGRAVMISPSLELIEIAIPFCQGGQDKNLVLSSNDLILVSIFYTRVNVVERKVSEIIVHKLNEESCEWVVTYSLDGKILLLGYYFSASVSAEEFEGCDGNCIISVKPSYSALPMTSADCCSLFNLKDGSLERLKDFPNYSKMLRLPESWLEPDLSTPECSYVDIDDHYCFSFRYP